MTAIAKYTLVELVNKIKSKEISACRRQMPMLKEFKNQKN